MAVGNPLTALSRSRSVATNLNQSRRGALPVAGCQALMLSTESAHPNPDHPFMTFVGDAMFHWRDGGPNPLVGVVATFAVAVLGYLACRNPKGRVAGIVLFGLWAAYVPFVFIGARIWPEEVSVGMKGIQGRHGFSAFSVDVADVESIRGSRGGKGGYALHVFLKSGKEAVGIPVIWDQHKAAYKEALHRVCPEADLDW